MVLLIFLLYSMDMFSPRWGEHPKFRDAYMLLEGSVV